MSRTDSLRLNRARLPWPLLAILVIFIAAPCTGAAEKSDGEKSKDANSPEAAIRATAEAFVMAFRRGDAQALAALWTETGTLVDDRGEVFKGRQAIEKEYAAFFKEQPGARMEVAIQSIEFATPVVAVEDGIARVLSKDDAPPIASRYTAIHVLQDGKWLMAGVRESRIEIPSNYPRLQELGWLVGSWQAKSEGVTVHTSIRWIANRSFLERRYTVQQDGLTTSSGLQIIGWDPQSGQVKSWSFDSSGGHGTGYWSMAPEGWQVDSAGVSAEGVPTSSRDSLIRIPGEDDVLGWRSVNRKAGGAELPDMPEVVLERLPQGG